MLNTSLVDSGTGTAAFSIITRRLHDDEDKRGSVTPLRKTWIYNSSGRVVGEITWTGRQPTDFVVAEEPIGSLKHLFGTSVVRFLPRVLSIPTRFDSAYVWTATQHSLVLLDYETETAKGRFHYNSVRIGKRFIKTYVHGFGHNYLEFQCHPLAHTVELIISFIIIEMVRRGRFSLQPYCFDSPKVQTLHEAYATVVRKMKTVQLHHELPSPVLSLLSVLPWISSSLPPSYDFNT